MDEFFEWKRQVGKRQVGKRPVRIEFVLDRLRSFGHSDAPTSTTRSDYRLM
ncbi:MAG: hypothetical protein R6U20_07530 [Longimonas sp.]